MTWFDRVFRHRQLQRDADEEIRLHLEEREDDLVAAGWPRERARLEARRAFGNVVRVAEDGRAVWRWNGIEDLIADLGYAARQLRATPSFALATTLTLALGIGANAAVFSVVYALVLQPLPFPHADRLVAVESVDSRDGSQPAPLSYPTFFEFRRSNVLAGIASYRDAQVTLAGGGAARVLNAEIVSSNLFDVLDVHVAAGRRFVEADERVGSSVAIVSHGVWTSQFGGNPNLVGRTITLDNQPFRVVGVAPEGFNYPAGTRVVDVWVTPAVDASANTAQPITEQRGARMLGAIARLADDDTLDRARARLDGVAAALARTYPDSNGNIARTSLVPELQRMLGDTRTAMLVLWGAVTLVLLIACANIANMLLARMADRERELGIRLAIGGSRGRVIRQLVTENLLVGILGSSAGLVIARLLLGTLLPASADRLPRLTPMTLDWRVLVFAVALSLLTTLLVSLPLAVRVGRIDFGGALRSAPRGATDTRDRVRSVLVVAQVALGLVLLSGAATMTAGLRHFTHRDLGFRPDHLLTFSVAASDANVPTVRQIQFTSDLVHALRAVPGVTSVAGSMALPLAGEHLHLAFDIPERPSPASERPGSSFAIVTPEFFDTIGATFEAGRRFTDQDDARHPRVVIVNRAFADRFFPGRRVLGRYIEPGATSDLDPPDGSTRRKEIVGVVANVRQEPLGHDAEPMYYLPYAQLAWMTPPMIVRTTGRPEGG